jgi:hypothetical protein
MTDQPGCGQHTDPDCLCDVHLTTLVDLGTDPIPLALFWAADYIGDKTGYFENPDDPIEFLATLADCYEQTAGARQMNYHIPSQEDVTHQHGDHDAYVTDDPTELLGLHHRSWIVEQLSDTTRRPSILDIATLLEDTYDEYGWNLHRVVQVLTANIPHPTWSWRAQDWTKWEAVAVSAAGEHPASHLCREFGVTETTLLTVCGWYGVKPYRKGKKGNRFCEDATKRRVLITEWLDEDPDQTPVQIHARLLELGFDSTCSSTRNIVSRYRRRNQAPYLPATDDE